MRIKSKHYPFAQRKYSLRWIWEANTPTLTNFTGPVYEPFPVISNLTELLQDPPGLNISSLQRVNNLLLSYDTITPPSFPSGWTISPFNKFYIQYYHHVFSDSPFSPNYVNTRPQRRNSKHKYCITAYFTHGIGGIIRAQDALWSSGSPFGSRFDISLSGYWGPTSFYPDESDFVETCVLPTLTRCDDCPYQEDTATYNVSDITYYTDSITSFGTVPTVVSDYMTVLHDTLKSELEALELSIKWRIAALPHFVPTSVYNSSILSSINPIGY